MEDVAFEFWWIRLIRLMETRTGLVEEVGDFWNCMAMKTDQNSTESRFGPRSSTYQNRSVIRYYLSVRNIVETSDEMDDDEDGLKLQSRSILGRTIHLPTSTLQELTC